MQKLIASVLWVSWACFAGDPPPRTAIHSVEPGKPSGLGSGPPRPTDYAPPKPGNKELKYDAFRHFLKRANWLRTGSAGEIPLLAEAKKQYFAMDRNLRESALAQWNLLTSEKRLGSDDAEAGGSLVSMGVELAPTKHGIRYLLNEKPFSRKERIEELETLASRAQKDKNSAVERYALRALKDLYYSIEGPGSSFRSRRKELARRLAELTQ